MQYSVKIKGRAPILLHKYTVSSIQTVKARSVKLQDSQNYSDEWKKGTYLNSDGNVVMPAMNIKACMFEGAKNVKIGKKSAARTTNATLLVSPFEPLLTVNGKAITLDDIEKNDWLNITGAVISGRRVDRIRTELPEGWEIQFEIADDEGLLSKDDIELILTNAGKAGLGDWRPSAPKKPGMYGTFDVVEFEVI